MGLSRFWIIGEGCIGLYALFLYQLYIRPSEMQDLVGTIIEFCACKNMFTRLFCRCKVFPRTKTCFYVFLCHCKVSAPAKTCFLSLLWYRMVGRIPLHLMWEVNGGSDIGHWLVTSTTPLACGSGTMWSYLNVVDGSIEQRLLYDSCIRPLVVGFLH
jgi:hypothetical protein